MTIALFLLWEIFQKHILPSSYFTTILSSARQSATQLVSLYRRKREPSSKAVEWESSLNHPSCMMSFKHSWRLKDNPSTS